MAAPPLHGEVSKTYKKQRHEGRQSQQLEGRQSQRLEGRQSQRLEGRQSQWLKGRQSQWHIIIPWRQRRRRDGNTGKMASGIEWQGNLLPLLSPSSPPSSSFCTGRSVGRGGAGSGGAAAGRAGCGALRRSRRREAGPDVARRKSAAGRVGAGLDAGVGAARACSDGTGWGAGVACAGARGAGRRGSARGWRRGCGCVDRVWLGWAGRGPI